MKIVEVKKHADLSKTDGFGDPIMIRYAIADDNGNVIDDA